MAGRLAADVAQSCVVTFEPVAAKVEAEFDRLFSGDLPAETEGEVEIDPEAEMPEPLVAGKLDLGEILAEELSLALDPYPRSPERRPPAGRACGGEAAGARGARRFAAIGPRTRGRRSSPLDRTR